MSGWNTCYGDGGPGYMDEPFGDETDDPLDIMTRDELKETIRELSAELEKLRAAQPPPYGCEGKHHASCAEDNRRGMRCLQCPGTVQSGRNSHHE